MLRSRTFGGLLALGFLLLPAALLRAQEGADAASPPIAMRADKTLHPGESDVYEFDGMTTAAVGSPLVADIVPLSSRRLLVNAKGVGETTLFVYDKRGKHQLRLAVILPTPDFGPLVAQIQADIGLPGVTVRAIKDTILLEGTVSSLMALQRAAAIAGIYTPKVRNLLTVIFSKTEATPPPPAQIYAALLTENLKDAGIHVQVVDDKTIALTGDYAPARSGSPADAEEAPPAVRWPRIPQPLAVPDPGADPGADGMQTDAKPAMGGKAVSSRSGGAEPRDPLNRLLQSLPPDLKVIDLLNLGSRPTRQILVRAKIIDIDRTSSKSLGIDWGTLAAAGSRAAASYVFQPQPILFGQFPAGGGAFNKSLLGGGALERISPFAAQLNLLISENKARVLSEPSLMVLDGNEGSILVGGEIPVPVAQSSSGTSGISASVTIQYKPYGVRLLVGASLVGDNAVQMTVTPEVSQLDYSAGVQISGFVVPGLSVRRATSTLQMADGETLVIGGLYSNTTSRQVDRIPLLSQIPILGEFFKSTTTRKEENELLILIQPEIVTPNTPGARPPAPGSPENLPIGKPDVGRSDFNQDFPSLQKSEPRREKTGAPVNLPAIPAPEVPR